MRNLFRLFCDFIFGKHKNNTLPRVWILAVDLLIVIIAYIVAVLMYYSKDLADLTVNWRYIWIYPLPYLFAFLISKTYDGMLRYSGFNDIYKILTSCTWTYAFYIISKLFFVKVWPDVANNIFPPFIVITYHYLITMVLMIILRLVIRRMYNETYKIQDKKQNTIIYGAGDAGTMLLRTLSQDTASKLNVVAFVDDNPTRVGKQINTVRIYAPDMAMDKDFIKKNNVEVMILAIPSLDEKRSREIMEQGLNLNLSVKTIPYFTRWVEGEFQANQIHDIKIEDLLGRNPIILGKENVSREVNDKVVLVTGAAGSIGSEICRQVMHYNPKQLIMLDQAESPKQRTAYCYAKDSWHRTSAARIRAALLR